MELEFKEYIVNSESDFIEDGIDKIKAHLTVCVQDVEQKLPILTYDLYVINLNTQTGIEMDEQRMKESIEFINEKFK